MATQSRGHRHRRLQRADRGRCQAPPDRRARGHQRRQRPGPARADGRQAHARRWATKSSRWWPTAATSSGEQILACDQAGITPLVPKPLTSNSQGRGPLRQARLHLHRQRRRVSLPCRRNGRSTASPPSRDGMTLRKYWSSRLPAAARSKRNARPSDYRRITRWEHEAVLEAMQRRLDRQPEAMTLRRQTVEHSFGTLKHWMGSTHFLTRTLPTWHRDEPARAGLQPQARDAHPGHRQNDEGDAVDERVSALGCSQRLNSALAEIQGSGPYCAWRCGMQHAGRARVPLRPVLTRPRPIAAGARVCRSERFGTSAGVTAASASETAAVGHRRRADVRREVQSH